VPVALNSVQTTCGGIATRVDRKVRESAHCSAESPLLPRVETNQSGGGIISTVD
jgi:hypothetical protein